MTGRDLDRLTLPYEAVDLGDGDRLALCVDDLGLTSIWIVRPLCETCDAAAIHGDASRASAPHEQHGPLPAVWRHRVSHVQPRCGRPTRTTGAPCRTPVAVPGIACGNHRTATRTGPNR